MKTFTTTLAGCFITLLFFFLTHLSCHAQIQFTGLVSQGEGIAGWNADGTGPEPAATGHLVPAPGYTSQYYYGSSRDYVTGDPNYSCFHLLPGMSGFPQFEQALTNHGFTADQVKCKYGLCSLGDDEEGMDWFFMDNWAYSNYYGISFTLEVDGEPMLSGYTNYTNMYINTAGSGNWQVESGYSPLTNIADPGTPAYEVAEAFLNDLDGNEIRTFYESSYGNVPIAGNGRSGMCYNVINGILEVGSPELPIQGLEANHHGWAYWDADGTGPEPQGAGPGGATCYYIASRDYDDIDPDPDAAMCEILDFGTGYMNFYLQLTYRGFSLDQVSVKAGLGSMDEKVEFEDWWYNGNYFIFNAYHNLLTIEVDGEPCIGFVMDTIHYEETGTNWNVFSSPGVMYDASENSSVDVQMVAQSFFIDVADRQMSLAFEHPLTHSDLDQGSRYGRLYEITSGTLKSHHAHCTRVYEGDVSGQWMASCSPYIIEGNITVPYGETLIIEPGVWLKFKEPIQFKVMGQLLCQGNESNEGEVVFTAVDRDKGWGHIEFPGTSATNDSSRFTHCIFEYGWGSGQDEYTSGGAMAIKFFDKILIDHCLFRYNWADNIASIYPPSGGAIGLWGSSPLIMHSVFHGNSAEHGGAIFSYLYSDPTIIRCLFYDNTVLDDGGAIDIYDHSMATINFCTFNNNSAGTDGTGEGGAVSLYSQSSMNLYNSILWGNTAPEGAQIGNFSINDTIIVKYCDVEGGEAGIGPNPNFLGSYDTTNMDTNPMFALILADNYMLSMTSPCIDAGNPEIIDPNGTACDMGAFFYPAPGIPVAIEATEVSFESFVANWEEAFGATKYYLDVAADPDFEVMIYSGINVGNVTSYEVDEVLTDEAYYRVRAYNSYGLSDYSNSIYVDLLTGMDEKTEGEIPFVIAPNPVSGTCNLQLNLQEASDVIITVYNFVGQKQEEVVTGLLTAGKHALAVDVSTLAPGTYFICLSIDRQSYTHKFIKID
ncbi:MAG: T9SS type A sorting domain-containing protein [Bacteroidetes bacterium]|nr:T9SS type A sorting domain-containing protein [Bacteroidota bacterium]